jgi:single-strand DNA-binding protein
MASSFDISGKLHRIYPAQQITDKFTKREFVIAFMDGTYESYAKMQLTNKNIDLLNAFKQDDNVTVRFSISGRPSTDRNGTEQFYTNLNAFSIQAGAGNNQGYVQDDVSQVHSSLQSKADDDDDLPF